MHKIKIAGAMLLSLLSGFSIADTLELTDGTLLETSLRIPMDVG